MAAFIHLREYWRAYLLNIIFLCLLLTTHTLAYGDAAATEMKGALEFTLGGGEDSRRFQMTDPSTKQRPLRQTAQ